MKIKKHDGFAKSHRAFLGVVAIMDTM